MNKDIILLFRCLCRDLGVQLLKPLNWQVVLEMAALKDELLSLAENEAWKYQDSITLSEYHRWVKMFHTLFMVTDHRRMRIWDLKDPVMFGNVYQLLSFLLKVKIEVTEKHEHDYIESLKKNEADCSNWRVDRNNPITRIARNVMRRSSAGFGNRASYNSQTGVYDYSGPINALDLAWTKVQEFVKHGPGATYMREAGSDKNWFNVCYKQLESYYPFVGFFANERIAWHFAQYSPVLREEKWVSARLTLVPKTVKGPRGVFISPKEAIAVQIGLDGALKDWVNRSWLKAAYQPDSQQRSRDLALESSATRESATLDLKDASDRIPRSLIAYMFHRKDYLAMACTRPSFIVLPNGEVLKASMASPMGDGKTFAVLSILSIILTVSAMLYYDGFQPTDSCSEALLLEYAKKIAVFGDDIIVPSQYFEVVCNALEMHNLKVNKSKSFVKGHFRESCGMDAFNGIRVTPLKLKEQYIDSESLPSWIDLHNRMLDQRPDLIRTIGTMRSLIESYFPDVGITTNSKENPMCLMVSRDEIKSYFVTLVNKATAESKDFADGIFPMPAVQVAVRRPGTRRQRIIRWNADLMKYEQRCLVGVDTEVYPSSLDPRWDLNYALLPKGSRLLEPCEGVPSRIPIRPIRKKIGSPMRAKAEQNDCAAKDRKLITLLDNFETVFTRSKRRKAKNPYKAQTNEYGQGFLSLAWRDIV